MDGRPKIAVCMVGAGEYNCGLVPGSTAAPDKRAGVVALTLFDLRARGAVGRILLTDAVGTRLPLARTCMAEKIGAAYRGLDVGVECFPADDVAFEPTAYAAAFDTMAPGDAVIVFTPDDTHGAIASAAIARGLHVLVAKPLVKTLAEHAALATAASAAGVLLAVEYHKIFDPIFSDARERARGLGPFSFFASTMTQRSTQLDTFRSWAGLKSDISYYLNSHFVHVHVWTVAGASRPVRVTAAASAGTAAARLGRGGVEDTITLLVAWENADSTAGHAVYTASWVAPTADCHTQQHFHYAGRGGELRVDQAHRGYTLSADAEAGGTGALATLNPLYMRYTPDARGYFAGQQGYGYRSIEAFVAAAAGVRNGAATAADVAARGELATAGATLQVTAILEAGRRSLDAGGAPVRIEYSGDDWHAPTGFGAL